MARLETSITLNCPADAVFEFLVRPGNRQRISPPDMQLAFIEAPELLELGSRFEFQVKLFGPPQRVVHEITEIDPPRQVVEKQVRGPLKHWEHEHVLEETEPRWVTLTDRIEFEPPGGVAGFLLSEERIRESVKSGLEHRHRQLKQLLEGNAD